jgi:hypothetical protein
VLLISDPVADVSLARSTSTRAEQPLAATAKHASSIMAGDRHV